MSEPHPSYLVTLVAGEFAEIDRRGARRAIATIPLAYLVPKGREADGRRTFARTPEMIEHFGEITGVALPVEQVRAGRRRRLHLRRDGEHHRDHDVRAHPARRARRPRRLVRRSHRPRARPPVVRRLRHVPRLVRGLAQRGLRDLLRARLAREAPRARRVRLRPQGRPRRVHRPRRTAATGAPSSARTTTRRSISSTATSTRRAASCCTRSAWSSATRSSGAGSRATSTQPRARRRRDARPAARHGGGERPEPGALLRAVGLQARATPRSRSRSRWEKGVLTVAAKQTQATTDGVPACFEVPLDLDVADDGERAASARATRCASPRGSSRSRSRVATRPAFVVVDPDDAHRRRGARQGARRHAARAARQGADGARALARGAGARAGRRPADHRGARAARSPTSASSGALRAECAAALGRIRAREALRGSEGRAATAHPKVRRAVVEALGQLPHDRGRRGASSRTRCATRATSSRREAARALGRTRQPAAFDMLVDLLERPSWSDVVRVGRHRRPRRPARRARRAAPRPRACATGSRSARAAPPSWPARSSRATARRARRSSSSSTTPIRILRIDVVRALGEIGDTKARAALRERLEIDLDARVRRRIREVAARPRRAAGAPRTRCARSSRSCRASTRSSRRASRSSRRGSEPETSPARRARPKKASEGRAARRRRREEGRERRLPVRVEQRGARRRLDASTAPTA